tara:strand:+ start:120 stop:971 length:852 start_codon:yes stop_codon:yes gene_type:complete
MAESNIGGTNNAHDPDNRRDASTDIAYNTTWGTIRIYNLAAHRAGVSPASVDFKAFVKTFRDSFSPGWKETQYPNQSVPIAHQVSPRRILQVNFSVPAASEAEAIRNMQKCTFLANSMYPVMIHENKSSAYRLKSTFMAVKFANLIQNRHGGPLPGYITSFSFIPNFEEGVFILNHADAANKELKHVTRRAFDSREEGYIIPKLVDIDLEFKPIEVRDNMGLQSKMLSKGLKPTDLDWKNDGWPHGIKIKGAGADVGSSRPALSPNSKIDSLFKSKASKIFNR